MDVDRLLAEHGRAWRGQQPAPPAPQPGTHTSRRRPPSKVMVAAAVIVVVVVAGVIAAVARHGASPTQLAVSGPPSSTATSTPARSLGTPLPVRCPIDQTGFQALAAKPAPPGTDATMVPSGTAAVTICRATVQRVDGASPGPTKLVQATVLTDPAAVLHLVNQLNSLPALGPQPSCPAPLSYPPVQVLLFTYPDGTAVTVTVDAAGTCGPTVSNGHTNRQPTSALHSLLDQLQPPPVGPSQTAGTPSAASLNGLSALETQLAQRFPATYGGLYLLDEHAFAVMILETRRDSALEAYVHQHGGGLTVSYSLTPASLHALQALQSRVVADHDTLAASGIHVTTVGADPVEGRVTIGISNSDLAAIATLQQRYGVNRILVQRGVTVDAAPGIARAPATTG